MQSELSLCRLLHLEGQKEARLRDGLFVGRLVNVCCALFEHATAQQPQAQQQRDDGIQQQDAEVQ